MMLIRHEALLRELWTTHLGVSPEVESDFMRAGGSSLLLMEIQLGIQKRSEIWIDLESLDLPIRFEGMRALMQSQAAKLVGPDSDSERQPEITVVDPLWPDSQADSKSETGPETKTDTQPDTQPGLTSDRKPGPGQAWLIGEAIDEPSTLPAQVERIARRHPNAAAVRDGDQTLSYGDLVASAKALAAQIRLLDGGSDRVVMIRCDPGIDYCIAVLGAISAGCFAAPINPGLPEARIKMMFDLAEPVAVIGGYGDDDCPKLGVERRLWEGSEESPAVPQTTLQDPCYALFTSGSTGVPKGVRMHQLPVANLARFESTRNGPEPAARTAQIAPLGFDVAFQEMFGTWAAGGELITVPLNTRRDPARLVEFLDEHRVTRMYCVPLLLRVIARASNMLERPLDRLQEVITAGEALRVDQDVREFGSACHSLRLMNQLGLAEAIQATHADLGVNSALWEDRPALGDPIPGVQIRVLDAQGQVADRDVEGEIEIGGFATGLGYIGDQDSDRFVVDSGTRWFRTGDHGLLTESGKLEFRGRRDHQVKIRGFRVEIGDVEHAITALPVIEEAAVFAIEKPSGDRQLMAVVTTINVTDVIDQIGILEALQAVLPPWMLPQRIRIVSSIPSNGNGKIDRSAARAMLEARPASV